MSGVLRAPQLAPGARWSLMFGNFVIGCGVMVVPGTLNDLARSLDVSVSLAGQLIAIAAATMALGAPLAAAPRTLNSSAQDFQRVWVDDVGRLAVD